ncbi:hypothetical protein GOODEAATRI_024753 [Goodea atripinnis]|uniref:Uncharacterized protein n=1 Tax=Goodea atripinnis TaxID=208336 RepID=A0ABV0MKK5_9TELE
MTPLMHAAYKGKADMCKLLLQHGADVNCQHDCVTVINNYFSRARLDYYTKLQGLEKEPKLPAKLAGPLHKIIMSTNLNPVKVVMLVKENPLLAEVEALDKCRRVMELICEKCIKQQDMNEVLAMKMHYISCVLGKCASFLKDREDKLDGLIKRWETGNDPTALSVLTQAITGQVGFMDTEFCTTCGEKGAEKRCSICKMVSFKTTEFIM